MQREWHIIGDVASLLRKHFKNTLLQRCQTQQGAKLMNNVGPVCGLDQDCKPIPYTGSGTWGQYSVTTCRVQVQSETHRRYHRPNGKALWAESSLQAESDSTALHSGPLRHSKL